MSTITYTFDASCSSPVLRGVTCTGGEVIKMRVKGGKIVDAVRFASPLVGGQQITVLLDGKPDLQAAVDVAREQARLIAAAKRAAIEAAVPGLALYEHAVVAWMRAQGAYEQASARGYPPTEAADLQAAEDVLCELYKKHPETKAYAQILAYISASHYAKSAAGTKALCALESGVGDVLAIANSMHADWSEAASRAVEWS